MQHYFNKKLKLQKKYDPHCEENYLFTVVIQEIMGSLMIQMLLEKHG